MISIGENPMPDDVDIVMTHGPPRGVLDLIHSRNEHAGCDAILNAVMRTRPLMHCFGHIHEGYGVELKTWAQEAGEESEAGRAVAVKVSQGA